MLENIQEFASEHKKEIAIIAVIVIVLVGAYFAKKQGLELPALPPPTGAP